MLRLQGRTALITGASRGIGRAIAERFAAEGAAVLIHFRADADAAEAVVAGIRAQGGTADAVQADVGRVEDICTLYERLDALSGGDGPYLDILVNNAALSDPSPFDKVTEAVFDRIVAVNLKGPFFMIQEGARRLKDGGRVINISALGAHRAYPDVPVYTPAKAGLNALTALLAPLLGPRGITVNGVSPGATVTDMSRARLSAPQVQESYRQRTPLGRVGEPADIADVCLFLASDDGRWITGQTLIASGGLGL